MSEPVTIAVFVMWSDTRRISASRPYIALRLVPYGLVVLIFPGIIGPAIANEMLSQRNKLTSGHDCQEVGPKTSMVRQ